VKWQVKPLMEMEMSADHEVESAALERLSALVDGELDGDATAQACAHWRGNEASRASWYAYQLIGDALRSEDLAGNPARDAGFLTALRARLAVEPVVLAPQALEAPPMQAASSGQVANGTSRGRWGWLAPSAVAAGFMAVAATLMLSRTPDAVPALRQGLAVATAPSPSQQTVLAPAIDAAGGDPQTLVASGAVIRDARLDRYLAAHTQFAGTSALGVPSGFLRSATVRDTGR
jgi:sigma-E factor negative regulatory protein RseA